MNLHNYDQLLLMYGKQQNKKYTNEETCLQICLSRAFVFIIISCPDSVVGMTIFLSFCLSGGKQTMLRNKQTGFPSVTYISYSATCPVKHRAASL